MRLSDNRDTAGSLSVTAGRHTFRKSLMPVPAIHEDDAEALGF